MIRFSRLATPAAHGETLVEPPAGEHAKLVESNRALFKRSSARFAGVDLATLRDRIRTALVGNSDPPIIVTGHQPEFIHAGVWAKHVVAVRLAGALGGVAVNLVADNDAPKETGLPVPTFEGERLHRRVIPYATGHPSVAYEGIAPVDADGRRQFESSVRAALGDRFDSSMLGEYFEAIQSKCADAGDWVDQMVVSRKAVERAFGIELLDRRISKVWYGPMLAEIIRDAERFADAYNTALADYRNEMGIRGARHPIPDLHKEGDRQELPLWAYRVATAGEAPAATTSSRSEPRRRLYVEMQGDRIVLHADNIRLGDFSGRDLTDWDTADAALQSLDGWCLRPRALMLTLWARLLLADLFVQGIGGAKYDRITDRIIRSYFGFDPPAMVAVSATLHLHLSHRQVQPEVGRSLHLHLRDLAYNPQRHLEDSSGLRTLVQGKTAALEELTTLRQRNRTARPRRRELFLSVRELNRQMLALQPAALTKIREQLAAAERDLEEHGIAMRRDFFFALHRRKDIELLLDRLPSVTGFGV